MKRLKFWRYEITCCAAAAMLAACGGPQPPGAMQTRTDLRGSMRTKTSSGTLLYVAYGREVAFEPFPKGGPVHKLSGLSGVKTGTLCSNRNGDVFVPQETLSEQQEILEYAHGETSPTNTLDSPLSASSCSSDPSTGNLAETGWGAHNSDNTIAIFSGASGSAQTYTDSNVSDFYASTYGDHGDLFLLGETSASSELIEFDTATGTFNSISLNESIKMYDLAWDGTYLAINGGDPQSAEINRVAVSGSTGTVVSTVHLTPPPLPYGLEGKPTWLHGRTFICPRGGNKIAAKAIDLWSYPKGGKPASVFHFSFANIRGVALSVPGSE